MQNRTFPVAAEQADFGALRAEIQNLPRGRIRLFVCRWCGGAERISEEILGAQQHHRGSQRDIKPPSRRSDVSSSFWECNRLLFWKILKIGVEDFVNGLVCISVRMGGVQLRDVRNLPCGSHRVP